MDYETLETAEFVNEVYTVDEKDYLVFITNHEAQLKTNQIPENFWKPLCVKLKNQIFDAGNNFSILCLESEDSSGDPTNIRVVIIADLIDPADGNNIYLIDHAWTYKISEAKLHLTEIPGLAERMARLMNLVPQSHSLVEDILKNMWKFNLTYSCSAFSNVEDQLPVWYVMDEFGSAIQHSDNPNFKIVPFLNLGEGIVYSLLFPLKQAVKGEEVTRDFVSNNTEYNERNAQLLPWLPSSLRDIDFFQSEPSENYFLSGRRAETLPNLDALIPKDTNGSALDLKPLKVFSEYSYINEYLTSPKFSLVTDQNHADILWLTSHFKQFKELSELNPYKYINQFPFENVITIKDLLAIVSRRNSPTLSSSDSLVLKSVPIWLPVTYNLSTELPKFVSYFQYREDKELDNYWICKPWNLARGMDTMITNNLDCIIRLSSSGHKIAQKYIENPVLFYRDGIGNVKFDVRYVLLLKSVRPLELYVYKNFFLRFANKPFEMSDFDDYEKHFTVMNYNENAVLHRLLCVDFIEEFNAQYPNEQWSDLEQKILLMFHQLFESASMKDPPCGIGKSPQSRALYAADLMLAKEENGEIQPKLLEVNWTPDCQRACEYYPNFYNDIFELLFLDEDKEGEFYKVV